MLAGLGEPDQVVGSCYEMIGVLLEAYAGFSQDGMKGGVGQVGVYEEGIVMQREILRRGSLRPETLRR